MSNPFLTIGQLRKMLGEIDKRHDDETLAVWLPGSRIDLTGALRKFPAIGKFPSEYLIEGNLRAGSALE